MPATRHDGGGEDLQDAAAPARTQLDVPARARRAAPRWPIFLGLGAAVIVLDQLTKAWIVATITPGESLRIVDDLVRLVYSRNTGALFGMFRDNATLFGAVSIAVIGGIAWYHARAAGSVILSAALGLLLGGAIGNLIDRLTRGHVVDFVDAGIGDLRFYTFNVADSAISTALLLLILLSIWPSLAGEPGREAARGPTQEAAPEPATEAATEPATRPATRPAQDD